MKAFQMNENFYNNNIIPNMRMKRVLFFSDLIGSVQSSSVVNGQYLGSALQVRPEELENNEQV